MFSTLSQFHEKDPCEKSKHVVTYFSSYRMKGLGGCILLDGKSDRALLMFIIHFHTYSSIYRLIGVM